MKLLLLSNGFYEGGNYLEYAHDWIRDHFNPRKESKTLLFVPYAKEDHDAYLKLASEALAPIGMKLVSAHTHNTPTALVDEVDGIFVAGGNTFRLLDMLQKTKLLTAIREKVASGMPYMGVSAGTNLAAPTIMTTNDMPIMWPATPEAFGFVPFQINCHYVAGKAYYDEDGVKILHNGETRDERIQEFHQVNELPVLALREGTGLHIKGAVVELLGKKAARLFRKGHAPLDVRGPQIASLSALRPF